VSNSDVYSQKFDFLSTLRAASWLAMFATQKAIDSWPQSRVAATFDSRLMSATSWIDFQA
jgi:hypothetical protein